MGRTPRPPGVGLGHVACGARHGEVALSLPLTRGQSWRFSPSAVPAFGRQAAQWHGRLRGPEPDAWVPVPPRTVTPSPSYGGLCALQWRRANTRRRYNFAPVPGPHGGGPRGQSPGFPPKNFGPLIETIVEPKCLKYLGLDSRGSAGGPRSSRGSLGAQTPTPEAPRSAARGAAPAPRLWR